MIKGTLLYLLGCLIVLPVFSQVNLILPDTVFKYIAATEEPAAGWMNPGFDDSSWSSDTGGIGFGNGFEDVLVSSSTKALYLRFTFPVIDKSTFRRTSLIADFDDGYIAYLNGKEILRVNIDKSPEFPPFDQLANRSHETEFDKQNKYPVLTYYLDSLLLDSCLVNGNNTLAFQVLNDSTNGSDLYFITGVINTTSLEYDYYSTEFRYKRQLALDSTKLPIVVINTDEFGIPYKGVRVTAQMGLINSTNGSYNKPNDSFTDYTGDISIELKGESSSDFPKQCYRFELIDSVGGDTNVSLIGMPRDNDWILFGPFTDKSQFRNTFEFELGRRLGYWEPRTRFCEVIMNGELIGLYALTETIKREKDRVDIAKLKTTDISGSDVTGGYILRYDKGAGGVQITYPKNDQIQPEQIAYINTYMSDYNKNLSSNKFNDPFEGFRTYIIDSTLIDYMVLTELSKNADGYLFSTYFYKDREDNDGRLHYGPLWDYDIAFGNSIFQDGYKTNGWQFEFNKQNIKIMRMLQDVDFAQQFKDRWHTLRDGPFSTDSLFARIDKLVSDLAVPIERNYQVWPVVDEVLFYPAYVATSYENEISILKSWIETRTQWIDDNIDNIYYPVKIYPSAIENTDISTFNMDVYPSPFTENLQLYISNETPLTMRVEMVNLMGQIQYTTMYEMPEINSVFTFDPSVLNSLNPGVYVVRIFSNNQLLTAQKILKR